MEIRAIRTSADYELALKEIETLMNAEAGSAAGERLEELVALVEVYERNRHSLEISNER